MGGAASRGRVSAYVPEDSKYVHPADSFDKKSKPRLSGAAAPNPRASASSSIPRPDLAAEAVVTTADHRKVRIPRPDLAAEAVAENRAGRRANRPLEEDEFGSSRASPVRVRAAAVGRTADTPNKVEDAISLPGFASNTGSIGIVQKAPRVISHQALGSQQLIAAQPLLGVQIRQPGSGQPMPQLTAEERARQQQAALSAIRAAAMPGKSTTFSNPNAVFTANVSGRSGPGSSQVDFARTATNLSDVASVIRSHKQAKPRFRDVEVSISTRKIISHWVRPARRQVKEKRNRTAQKQAQSGPKKRKRPHRVDKLVEMYLENEEELERLCFEDPQQLILTQIELLTQRIEDLAEQVAEDKRQKAEAAKSAMSFSSGAGAKGSKEDASAAAPAEKTEQIFWDWDSAFDVAMRDRDEWKRGRGERQKDAQEKWRQKVLATWPAPGSTEAKTKSAKDCVLEQMQAERENLQSLLPRFEAQMRREQRRQDQPTLDLAEALQEEQREAMAQRAQELREERRRAAEVEDRLRREKAKVEEEQRHRQEEEAESRRRRKAEEERIKHEEQEREEEERRREAAEEERKRAEEEERRIREKEEQELERLRREKKESERRRAEERQQVAEREAKRQKEIEERRRQEQEKWAAERRQAEELERQRKATAEEQRELAEREQRRAEEERQRAEKERQRAEEERRAAEELKDRRAAARQALLESAFDDLETAASKEPVAPVPKVGPPKTTPSSNSKKRSGGMDWMSRALGALNDGDEESDASDSDDEDAAGGGGEPTETERLAADVQLLRVTEDISERIAAYHS